MGIMVLILRGMNKRIVLSVVVAVVFLAFIPHAYPKTDGVYQNTRYGYSLKYPASWFIGYLGPSEKDAVVLRICSDVNSTQFGDAGIENPLVEIIVSDLKELKEVGSRIPGVKSPKDWLDWDRSNWDEPERERIGPYRDEKIIVSGSEGVKTTYSKPIFPGAGPVVEVILFNPATEMVYSIKYFGDQRTYGENLKHFENILKSFSLAGISGMN